ncbi:hypothetical protein [Nesterenkonia salmonea]|uniref:hypothetical protein n=1 Tax=Nesterenkonia salmonea TaxID=1804987 RepID=UPI001AA05203|nr:hypothetical protein [Nesterenkonia salmonea]
MGDQDDVEANSGAPECWMPSCEAVRRHVLDVLTDEQVDQLREITDAMLRRLDPDETLGPVYRRHDT